MSELTLLLGSREVRYDVESDRILSYVEPRGLVVKDSPEQVSFYALDAPLGCPLLSEIVRPQLNTVIVVPDKTRMCGAAVYLPILVDRLNALGVRDADITILLAMGAHPPHKPEEIDPLVGPRIAERVEVVEHNARSPEELIRVGTTSRGIPVWLNKRLLDAECLIVTGTAVHHYFAGYGGGAKMINPGCAGYETITANHALTIDRRVGGIHPNCRPGVRDGNPVLEDLRESMGYVSVDFALITLLDETGQVAQAFAGELFAAHDAACKAIDAAYRVVIPEKADLVVVSCGGYPKDINLIQAHKSLHNAYQAVKSGGVILWLAECRDGLGSQTFLPWFEFANRGELIEALSENYMVNGTTALSLMEKAEDVDIILVSNLETSLVARLGLRAAPDMRSGMQQALSRLPDDYTMYVMPNGSVTLPYVATDG